MTSRLAILRSQLARLRRVRAALRAMAAWSALASGVVLALMMVFALDLLFGLAVPQRLVVFALAVAGVCWTYGRFTRPLLGRREAELDVALIVERQQQIDSDLVAALQFERPDVANWGSPKLAGAVVEYVAAATPAINVFQGLPRAPVIRRLAILGASLAVALVAVAGWPGHIAAFANRLCLGSKHYPTQTRIEQIVVNTTATLWKAEQTATPRDAQAAQGRPLSFLVQCSGRLPAGGAVYLTASDNTHARTRLELKPLSLDERLARLQTALAKLDDAAQSAPAPILEPWRNEIISLIRFDAPAAVPPLMAAKQPSMLSAAISELTSATTNWPAGRSSRAIFKAELGRLNEDLTYKIAIGDAWSDPAKVRMIPLPIVELEVTAVPPKYATASTPKTDTSGRQIAVLEGSSVQWKLTCTNRKPLAAAWLLLQRRGGNERMELASVDRERFVWSPAMTDTPLERVHEELQYEMQVVDADGLSLPTPLRGAIRIKPDQPPTALAEAVHKVVLPTAEPVIGYRASDDHGISRLTFVVDVERGSTKAAADAIASDLQAPEGSEVAPAVAVPAESHRYDVLPRDVLASGEPIASQRLPLAGSYALRLAPLKLAKGDRIKLTLEVTDYRGENDQGQPAGVAQRSEPVVLEISDESGVLAAISQPDQRSVEQLSEIIKRQLGIGEEP